MDKRGSGILLHITSLPDKLGLGNFSANAYEFIRFLNKAKCKYWQVLPFNHCNYGESPYSSFSAFAGNPYFIDLRQFLSEQQLEECGIVQTDTKDCPALQDKLDTAMRLIFSKNKDKYNLENFIQKNKYWLEDYALYMSIKNIYKVLGWRDFPTELKNRNKKALKDFVKTYLDEINYHIFLQYIFFMQWQNIRKYANECGVQIIGDLPIYVDMNSCDVWVHKNYFQLDTYGNPLAVSGTPPDFFSEDGQLWGNPLYNFEVAKQEDYSWFVKRVQHSQQFFDILRIDHFAGFVNYWAVPYKAEKAKAGKWMKGPGIEIFEAIRKNCSMKLVLEDLGFLSKEVLAVKNQLGLPGIKILQYGFDQGYSSGHLPHNYEKNCFAYLGNHDNDTYKGYLNKADCNTIKGIKNYLDLPHSASDNTVIDKVIRCLYASSANTVLFNPQDLLKQDTDGRMNIPGTVLPTNWKYQLAEQMDDNTAHLLKYYSEIFDR